MKKIIESLLCALWVIVLAYMLLQGMISVEDLLAVALCVFAVISVVLGVYEAIDERREKRDAQNERRETGDC